MDTDTENENGAIVIFTASTPRKTQHRVWKQGDNYILPLPRDIGAKVRGWGAEDLFVLIGRQSKIQGETFTIKVPAPSVKRSRAKTGTEEGESEG